MDMGLCKDCTSFDFGKNSDASGLDVVRMRVVTGCIDWLIARIIGVVVNRGWSRGLPLCVWWRSWIAGGESHLLREKVRELLIGGIANRTVIWHLRMHLEGNNGVEL
jgi:hypothetical protein